MISYLTNFLEKEKNRKIIKGVFYAAITVMYLFIALHFIYTIGTYLVQDIVFSFDSARVYKDWTLYEYNHYRTKVHPLYCLIVYPIVKLLSFVFKSKVVSVVILIALSSVLNVYLLNSILDKLTHNKDSVFISVIKAIIVVFYALSFTQLINSAVVESFGLGTLTLLLFWNYMLTLKDKELNLRQYAILVFLGVLIISMVITNIFHFAIGTFCLIMIKKKKGFEEWFGDFLVFVLLNVIVVVVSYHLCNLQMKIFPKAENAIDYFIVVIKDFLFKTAESEEMLYVASGSTLGIKNVVNVFMATFCYSFFGYKMGYKWDYWMNFYELNPINYIYSIIFVGLFIFALVMIVKNKRLLITLPIVLSLFFEMAFHVVYGNDTLMIYAIFLACMVSIIIFVGLSEIKYKYLQKIISFVMVGFTLINIIFNAITLKDVAQTVKQYKVAPVSEFWLTFILSILQILIIVLAVVAIKALVKNFKTQKENEETQYIVENNKCKIFASIKNWFIALKNKMNAKRFFALCVAVVSILTIGLEVVTLHGYKSVNNKVTAEYESSKIYIDREAEITTNYTILFGMGLRNKFMIQKASAYPGDAKIYKFWPGSTYKEELCRNVTVLEYDSVNYTAKLRNETTKEIFYMIENENGVYFKKGNKLTTLDNSQHINIPTFEEYEHPELMRAYFGEMMVNITTKGVVSNLLYSGKTYWYKHTAIVAMALEKTGNLSQILPVINSITPARIYDYARNGNVAKDSVKHIDNLGEVLYLMSLLDTPKQDVVNAILTEAKKYEKNNPNVVGKKYIEALTDGYAYPSYQTKWLKFGMDSLGLDSSAYDVTGLTDWQTSTAWFFDRSTRNNLWVDIEKETKDIFNQETSEAYSKFAMFHRYNTKIEIPDEIIYPMTHGGKIGYEGFVITHSLTAAEGLLYLYDYKDYT